MLALMAIEHIIPVGSFFPSRPRECSVAEKVTTITGFFFVNG